jgi:hypothetical protein
MALFVRQKVVANIALSRRNHGPAPLPKQIDDHDSEINWMPRISLITVRPPGRTSRIEAASLGVKNSEHQ